MMIITIRPLLNENLKRTGRSKHYVLIQEQLNNSGCVCKRASNSSWFTFIYYVHFYSVLKSFPFRMDKNSKCDDIYLFIYDLNFENVWLICIIPFIIIIYLYHFNSPLPKLVSKSFVVKTNNCKTSGLKHIIFRGVNKGV